LIGYLDSLSRSISNPRMKMLNRWYLYSVLVSLVSLITQAQTTFTLNPLTSFGPNNDGSIRPGQSIGTSPVTGNEVDISGPGGYGIQPGDGRGSTNGFDMRGLAADPITGNLVFVDTHTGSGGASFPTNNSGIYILNRDSGQIVGALNTNQMTGGSLGPFITAGVADDGVVYIANQINAGSGGAVKIYRFPTANPSDANFSSTSYVCFSNSTLSFERLALTMAVRGAGTNTQIIIGTADAAKVGATGGPGTNVFLFTTSDGTNFVHHRMYIPNFTTSIFNDGIAFGPTNTFWVKEVGGPLVYLAFDPTAATNAASTNILTVIASYTASGPNDPLLNISDIAVDNTNHLLAGMEEIGGSATGGNGKIWLYDISNPTNQAPAILATRVYLVNLQKTTAPMGYMCFSGGRLYAHASNNGFLVSTVGSISITSPTYTWTDYGLDGNPYTRVSDLPTTTRSAAGQSINGTTTNQIFGTAHFEVFATPDVTNYTWYSNSVVVPGAHSYYLDVSNITTNNNGDVFYVVAQNAVGTAESTHSTLQVVDTAQYLHPSQLWSSTAGTTNYIDANGGGTPAERTLAYNALSNQLLVVKGPSALSSLRVFVLDANTGQYLYPLKTNGITTSGALTLCGIAVADDGAVYAASANGATITDQSFKIYRWADSGSNTIPVLIWGTNSSAANANPAGDVTPGTMFRYGDNLAVQGSGNNTLLIVDAQNNSKYAGILNPVPDGTMTNWQQTGFVMYNSQNSYGSQAWGTSIGRSLQFGPTFNGPFGPFPTFWQKRYVNNGGAPLCGMGYYPGGGVAPLQVACVQPPLFTNGPVGINFSLNLCAAIAFVASPAGSATTPDYLAFYDITDPSQPILVNSAQLPGANSGGHAANNNFIGQVVFGVNAQTSANYVFCLNANNGVSAYALVGGVTPAPKILTQPQNQKILLGSTATLSVYVDQPATISWYSNSFPATDTGVRGNTFTATNPGSWFVIASNINGSVTSVVASVTVSPVGDVFSMTKAWGASLTNALYPYVSSTGGPNAPNERYIAYNALSNQLIVTRYSPSSPNPTVFVVDGTFGTNYYTLNTNGILHEGASEVSGSNPLDIDAVAVSDEGSIYVCSESPNASGGLSGDTNKMFHIYRYTNSAPTTPPVLVYEGDPSGAVPGINNRWGDAMTATGSGINTRLFLDSQDGGYGAIMVPIDASLNSFTNLPFNSGAGSGSIGRSLQFGTNTTVLQKRKGNALSFSTYSGLAGGQIGTATVIQTVNSSTTLGGVAVDPSRSLAAGVDFIGSASAPDAVSLFDISTPASPLLLKQLKFPQNQIANANAIAQTVMAGNKIFALDANNGIMAFYIDPPTNSMKLTIVQQGSNVNLSWGYFGAVLQSATNLTSPTWMDASTVGQTNATEAQASQKFYRLIDRR
jgi:hypothetical protein